MMETINYNKVDLGLKCS